ncbi:mannosyl-oligosaccharide 1,2-alpha-mannosidase precursor [Pseudovirgaria hyperparasitica]|uniref:alpha-1,2-Mannosidase n=1 Tax=Pseudovirgaria hyperparasitica TaxID=470096 RepID=A0A6A6W7E2_9PEZI|nr:mannosyl-oligosaccharide 1,2-alpha-mannosidase precursor [Pseudovirgaria hyperparasitica]KAF2757880.1 mannosyl-oligosaccharide 1,2-alpha-mannosidase precursor [Pseudovirgaria hyperparasitica]
MLWPKFGAISLCASVALALPRSPASIRKREDQERADAVKAAFQHAWDGYKQYAFPNDELKPVSNSFGNSRNGWGASAVDALSTALLMGNQDVVDTVLEHITTIDYTKTDTEVSLFETTIRYLGGMLSAYDLLKGPLSNMATDYTKVDALLTKSKELADALKFAFDTTSGVPHNNLIFANRTYVEDNGSNGLATVGTLVLEWTHLSDLLGVSTYQDLAEKGESYLLNPMPTSNEPWPGLIGSDISIEDGTLQNANGGWSGGQDSFYEYLLKMYVYDQSRFGQYKDRWVLAADSTIAHLTSHPQTRPEVTFVAEFRGQTQSLNSGHLTCFHGGNFLLGGAVLGEQKYIDYGLALVDSCHATYNATATKIGPERWSWDPENVPADQQAFWEENGFYITVEYYDLRPEVVESFYHAYRITGEQIYADWVWDAFIAVNSTARRGSGFDAIENVNVEGGGTSFDNQESFLYAEVMKYFYLTFAGEAEWQVSKDGKNAFVFNTEAHPFKVVGGS